MSRATVFSAAVRETAVARTTDSSRSRLSGIALFAAIAGAAALGSGAAVAQTAEQRVDNRQDRQQQRIEQGAGSGALTPHETRRLARQQAGVVRAEGRAEADGTVSRREGAALERRQDRASRDIYRQKHDRQTRGR